MGLQKFTDYTLDVQRCQSCLELGANFQGGSELSGPEVQAQEHMEAWETVATPKAER